nr:sugar nucleotide-binding protein [Nitrospirillum iridis]
MGSSSSNDRPHLVVGGDGMVGAALVASLRLAGETVHATTRRPEAQGPDRPLLDLTRPQDGAALGAGPYRTAYICAAVARLDDCFKDPPGAFAINVTNMAALANRLLADGTHVIFLSTNQVLDGNLAFPDESASLAPSNVYGHQKAAAEQALWDLAARHPAACVTVLRLSKVLPSELPLFTSWAAALANGRPIRAAEDMSLAPLPVELVVDALRRLAQSRWPGLFQLSSATEIDYAAAARHLCRHIGADPALVRPVHALAAGFVLEPPPRHTIMDSGRLTRAVGIHPPDPFAVLDRVFAHLPPPSRDPGP